MRSGKKAVEGNPAGDDVPARPDVVVIGGGPAGLTAAYQLCKAGVSPQVFEKEATVGGLARTECFKGYHFDMGGHRFFTKSPEVSALWEEILGEEFLKRPRLSRIYFDQKFFDYPLKPLNALRGLGILESVLSALSYLRWQLFPHRPEETFEHWVTNRFGRRLFLKFFKSYTEKVWGISCSELRAEWAAQRIKDLSLKTLLLGMLIKPKRQIKTLIEEFHYPRLGPGLMWRTVRDRINEHGGSVESGCEVVGIRRRGLQIESITIRRDGREQVLRGSHFVSSMPVTEFLKRLDPAPPDDVLEAARSLKYRDFLTVCLIVNRENLLPDNWIYIHEPDVQVGRIQNFKNWSPDMVPDLRKTSLGLEYFCNEGDALWSRSDADLIALGKKELEQVGLAKSADVEDGCVFRIPKSYPVYDEGFQEQLQTIRSFVDRLENFQTIGRNGLHRYNNQDHAMLTGMAAARRILTGEKLDLWSINADQSYHEELTGEDAQTREEAPSRETQQRPGPSGPVTDAEAEDRGSDRARELSSSPPAPRLRVRASGSGSRCSSAAPLDSGSA